MYEAIVTLSHPWGARAARRPPPSVALLWSLTEEEEIELNWQTGEKDAHLASGTVTVTRCARTPLHLFRAITRHSRCNAETPFIDFRPLDRIEGERESGEIKLCPLRERKETASAAEFLFVQSRYSGIITLTYPRIED